ncbi:MAG: THUMP-like domain-containing protein [Actinomycetales bacterium]
MEVGALRVLAGPDGPGLLAHLVASVDSGALPSDPLSLVTALRRTHPPELAAALAEQVLLRPRARRKLGPLAESLLVTGPGLEQMTRPTVAAHRAARLARSLPDAAIIADLGCGLGGELLALARSGLRVLGAELDEVTALVAAVNVTRLGLAYRAAVTRCDVTALPGALRSPNVAAVVADPARRTASGRRVFDPDAYTPPWPWVLDLLGGVACVKVAPGLPHELVPEGCEAEWVSDDGDLVEAALWSPALATARHRATLLPSGDTLTDADDPGPQDPVATLRYLYEPDPSALRAGLVTAVGALLGARQLHPEIAYLTSDHLVASRWARAWEVEAVLPLSEKLLRQELRARGVGVLTVKKRGVGVDPETFRKRMRLSGDNEATIVITRLAPASGQSSGQAVALLARPLPTQAASR